MKGPIHSVRKSAKASLSIRSLACGFDGMQFHDDDVVPNMNELTPKQIIAEAKKVKAKSDEHGLTAEFVKGIKGNARYAFKSQSKDGRNLTAFVGKADWTAAKI